MIRWNLFIWGIILFKVDGRIRNLRNWNGKIPFLKHLRDKIRAQKKFFLISLRVRSSFPKYYKQQELYSISKLFQQHFPLHTSEKFLPNHLKFFQLKFFSFTWNISAKNNRKFSSFHTKHFCNQKVFQNYSRLLRRKLVKSENI